MQRPVRPTSTFTGQPFGNLFHCNRWPVGEGPLTCGSGFAEVDRHFVKYFFGSAPHFRVVRCSRTAFQPSSATSARPVRVQVTFRLAS